jgi:hypothetical protein
MFVKLEQFAQFYTMTHLSFQMLKDDLIFFLIVTSRLTALGTGL